MEAALKSGVRWMGEEDEERWSDHDLGSPLLASAKLMGRYALIEPIGHGGTSTVWRALDERENAHVAVKLMAQDPQREARLVESFKREVELAAQLDGDAYVKIKDSGVEDGRAFLVMELLEGESLQERLGRVRRFSARQAVDLSQGLREALTRAHALEIVHRDIKPGNIFYARVRDEAANDERELIKLLDFGIAKDLWAGARLTATGSFLGTSQYMSPEQFKSGKDVDSRADLWSVAIVLYRALTGTLPFVGPGIQLALRVAEGKFEPPTRLLNRAPPELDQFFERALARNADERFATVEELHEAFAAALRGMGSQAPSLRPAGSRPSLAPPTALGPAGYDVYAALASSAGSRDGQSVSDAPTAIGALPDDSPSQEDVPTAEMPEETTNDLLDAEAEERSPWIAQRRRAQAALAEGTRRWAGWSTLAIGLTVFVVLLFLALGVVVSR
jgi:serine/threonine protein kinase